MIEAKNEIKIGEFRVRNGQILHIQNNFNKVPLGNFLLDEIYSSTLRLIPQDPTHRGVIYLPNPACSLCHVHEHSKTHVSFGNAGSYLPEHTYTIVEEKSNESK